MADHATTLLRRMEAHGLRITRQRRVVAELLEQTDVHLDAEEVFRRARVVDPGVHRATVYRTLDRLKQLGLLDELAPLQVPGERHVYEVAAPHRSVRLTCRHCGLAEPADGDLREALERQIDRTGFLPDAVNLEVGGTCRRCRNRHSGRPTEDSERS